MAKNFLVLQSDFGLVDGAVSAMHGVAYQVAPNITVDDLTHDIPPFNIFQASFRLYQTIKYWPVGTVFVSVVDPGVGSNRHSIAVRTHTGHIIVTPDNGSLTHIAAYYGIDEAVYIDEDTQRLPGSENSNTFHGRDIFTYNAARLADGQIQLSDLGETIDPANVVTIPITPSTADGKGFTGTIEITDVRFGHLWTNISLDQIKAAGWQLGDNFEVKVLHDGHVIYANTIPYVTTFSNVEIGDALIYVNSVYTVAVGLRNGNFAKTFNIGTGTDWTIQLNPSHRS